MTDSQTPPPKPPNSKQDADQFARESQPAQAGFFREFVDFLLHNKKWWLAPIIIVLLLVGLLAILATTGAAPFIYTLF